jgi:cytochrome c peroxidase
MPSRPALAPLLAIAGIAAPAALGVAMFSAAGGPRGTLLPDVPFPIGNPLTEDKRVLGKILFYDEQLSTDNTVACATCHAQTAGSADRRRVRQPGPDGVLNTPDDIFASPGVIYQDDQLDYAAHPVFGLDRQVTGRAAPPVINAAHFIELFWDGRVNDIFHDPETGEPLLVGFAALESQAVNPPLASNEMAHHARDWPHITGKLAHARPLALASDIPPDMADAVLAARTYPELFRRAFGDADITPARIAMAIATYERTLIADQTPWDAWILGDPSALTAQEIRGWNAFEAVRCTHCHLPPLFTNSGFANLGIRPVSEDRGRQNVTGQFADRGKFKIPGLRNVGIKSSYMHNGQFTDLLDVVNFYATPKPFPDNVDGFANVNLTNQQRTDMGAFLQNALTDPRVANAQFPFDAARLHFHPANTPNPAVLPGTGRPDSQGSLPRIIAVTPPLIGADDFKIGLTDVPEGAQAVLHISFQEPIDGVVAPDAVLGPFTATHPDGLAASATAHWPVPFSPILDGRTVHMQWVVNDPGADQPALSPIASATFFCGFGDCATGCLADINRDRHLDFFDITHFLALYNQQAAGADLAEPLGVFNFFDLAAFLDFFNTGCP